VAAAIVGLCSTSSGAEQAAAGAVDVVLVGSEADARSMREVAEELLARLGVTATVTLAARVDPGDVINPKAGAEPRVARAWIDLSRTDRATLYLVDRDWERVLIRHLRKSAGHEELTREAVGHVLETAVDALLHGARIGVVREEARRELEEPHSPAPPPESSPVPGPPEPEPARPSTLDLGLRWGAAYEAGLYASGVVVTHGPEATLVVVSGHARVRPGLWLTLQYRLPLTVDAEPLGVRLDAAAGRLLAAIEAPLGARTVLRAGLGAGIDAVHSTPLGEQSQASPASAQNFVITVGRASAGLAYALSRSVSITSVVSCDLDVSGTRYVSVVDGTPTPALSPWTLRPALAIGVELR
jgi:hypothetical protein